MMSAASADFGSLSSLMSRAGWPIMPQLVVLTTIAAPSSASWRSVQGRALIGPPNRSRALLRQPVAHRPRAAPRADHGDRPRVRPPAGVFLPDRVDEAVAIVVGAR